MVPTISVSATGKHGICWIAGSYAEIVRPLMSTQYSLLVRPHHIGDSPRTDLQSTARSKTAAMAAEVDGPRCGLPSGTAGSDSSRSAFRGRFR